MLLCSRAVPEATQSPLASRVPSSARVGARDKMPSRLQGAHGCEGGTPNSSRGPEAPQGPTQVPVQRIWGRCSSSTHILFCSSMQILSLLPV